MNRLKLLREKQNMKQSELGKLLNVKDAAISKYESGKVPLTADTLIELSKIFHVSIDYILGISDQIDIVNEDVPLSIYTLSKQLKSLLIENCDLDLDFYAQVGHFDSTVLQKYVNGEAFPSSYDLCKLIEIFDTTADYLFGKSNTAHPQRALITAKSKSDFSHILKSEMDGNYLESELANALDISISKIRKLLNNEEKPSPEILESISQILKKSTDYMLGICQQSREPNAEGQYPFHMDIESIKRLQVVIGENWTDYDASELGLTYDEFYKMYHYGFIPHISVLYNICKYYHISCDYLLNLSDSKLCIQITRECDEDDLITTYRKLKKPYQRTINGVIAEQLLQQERDNYMRTSVAADDSTLKKTGTDNLGK